MPDFIYSSIYGELTKQVQLRFDAVSKLNKQLFDNVIFEKYLNWDTPSIGLTFEELKGLYNVTIAAATIGDNSNEPIIGHDAPETMSQKVLQHAITKSMTTQVYRKVLELQETRLLDDQTKRNELIKLMFKDVEDVVNGVLARLDIIFLNALSNEGVCTLDKENNPEGGVRTTIDYGMPSDNKLTVETAWTEDNKDTVNVIDDIFSVVDAADGKVVFDKILMDRKQLAYITRTTLVKKAIWGSDKSATPVTLALLNQFLTENELPQIEIVRRHVQIQDNGKLSTYKPWNANNLVFIPAGSLGSVKNAYADNELKQESGVTYSNYNRIRVSQWGVGETQNSRGVEFVKAQVFALPVISAINGIYSLNVGTNIQATSVKAEGSGISTLNANAEGEKGTSENKKKGTSK